MYTSLQHKKLVHKPLKDLKKKMKVSFREYVEVQSFSYCLRLYHHKRIKETLKCVSQNKKLVEEMFGKEFKENANNAFRFEKKNLLF